MGFWFSQKRHPVSTGGDAFLADGRGVAVNIVLDKIAKRLHAHDTLAVFPEGVMLNYLARRVNPTPYITLMPPELTRPV